MVCAAGLSLECAVSQEFQWVHDKWDTMKDGNHAGWLDEEASQMPSELDTHLSRGSENDQAIISIRTWSLSSPAGNVARCRKQCLMPANKRLVKLSFLNQSLSTGRIKLHMKLLECIKLVARERANIPLQFTSAMRPTDHLMMMAVSKHEEAMLRAHSSYHIGVCFPCTPLAISCTSPVCSCLILKL